jgi:hypothetical protein
MNSKQTKTIENALYYALKSHGLLAPVSTEHEEGATGSLLPAELNNPETFIKKVAKVVSIKSNRNRINKRSQLAKVAMKGGAKSKPKKKK